MRTTDVAIVGAGFAGLSTAYALRRRGVKHVVVLERESAVGTQASGRGAGLGRQLAEDDVTSALTIRGVARLRDQFSAAFAPTGGILTFDDAAAAEVYAARARTLGVTCERIDHASVLRVWPSVAGLPIEAALRVPGDGVIDNQRLLAAYAKPADIAYGTAVTRVEPRGALQWIETTKVSFSARVVVDAAGAWAGAVVGDPPLESVKRHLFVVEAAPAADAPYLWHLGASELYVRPGEGGVLACPCDADPTPAIDQQPSPDADARLGARFAAAGWNPRVVRRWACQRAFAPDRRMRIGRDPDRPWLVWAAALGGHGATASAAIGEDAASAAIEALG